MAVEIGVGERKPRLSSGRLTPALNLQRLSWQRRTSTVVVTGGGGGFGSGCAVVIAATTAALVNEGGT